jgi:hypothetical protein
VRLRRVDGGDAFRELDGVCRRPSSRRSNGIAPRFASAFKFGRLRKNSPCPSAAAHGCSSPRIAEHPTNAQSHPLRAVLANSLRQSHPLRGLTAPAVCAVRGRGEVRSVGLTDFSQFFPRARTQDNRHYIGSTMRPGPLPAPRAVATAAAQSPIAPTPIPPDATEEQLIGLWLHGKSGNTIRAYRRDVAAFIGKPIRRPTSATSNATPMRSRVRRRRVPGACWW